jgi:3-methyladenine DNA glycosylase Tag
VISNVARLRQQIGLVHNLDAIAAVLANARNMLCLKRGRDDDEGFGQAIHGVYSL